jgi:adenosylcobinamide-GDP ribazoletransferase
VARATPALLARLFGPARADGQGAAFVAGVGRLQATLALVVAALVAVAVLGRPGLLAAGLALLAAAAVAGLIARRLGGVTGDVFGAAVESAELVAALAMVAWLGAQA